ncbi:amidase [Dyella sp.]|uniref:amidase n=1 Tax=Dyella sp. TaxID=1869338 RepID=UPI002ED4919B
MNEWHDLPLRELAVAVSRGQLDALEITRDCLARIDACEDDVQAWAAQSHDFALAQASVVQNSPGKALCGVPFGAKDIIDTVDLPTAYGSGLYEGFRPGADASCITLARRAGALLIGKTVTAEFALSAPGATRNPHALEHTPGGSSSGSAAAVAAGMVPVALATQTGGSIIRPAAYCGVVGFKPSFGLIDRTGIKPLSPSLDTVGVIARRVDDAACFSEILARRPWRSQASTRSVRIGRYDTANWGRLAPAVNEALRESSQVLTQLGFALDDVKASTNESQLKDAYQTIVLWEIAATLAYEHARGFDRLREQTRAVLTHPGPTLYEYDTAQAQAQMARTRLDALFGTCDVLLAPAVPDIAPAGIAQSGDPSHCLLWSLLHTPAITLPVTTGPLGLPVGVQLIARVGNDALLLAVANRLEQALPRIGEARVQGNGATKAAAG